MTPEEFAAKCAAMRDYWTGLGMGLILACIVVGAGAVLCCVIGGIRAGWRKSWDGSRLQAVTIAFTLCIPVPAALMLLPRVKAHVDHPERVIYNRDFAEQDYRAFLERMKYEPKGESK